MTLSEAIADFERRKYALEKALQAALLHDTKGKIVELAQDIYSFLVPSVSEEGSDDPHILRKRARDLSENEPLVNAALKEVISQPLSGLGVYPQPDNNPAPSKTPDDDEWASVTNKQQAELPERKSHSNFQPRKQPVVHIRKPYDKGRIPNHDDMADVTYTPPAQGFVAQDGFCMPTPVVETAPQPEPEKKTDDPPRGAISYEPANKVATVSDYVAPEAQIERVADTLSKIPRGGASVKSVGSSANPKTERPTLTGNQRNILKKVMELNAMAINATLSVISERVGAKHPANVRSTLCRLLELGYLTQRTLVNPRHPLYLAVRDEHGNDLNPTEKREDGVTICPPRYAAGYGISESSFEQKGKLR